mmetsp:Transcript_46367/g.123165  ORF Transcript_46367/g.123165 Transcript_46367/m.123165 type:complete len:275 (+) Transcript_46367:620-1444(+)
MFSHTHNHASSSTELHCFPSTTRSDASMQASKSWSRIVSGGNLARLRAKRSLSSLTRVWLETLETMASRESRTTSIQRASWKPMASQFSLNMPSKVDGTVAWLLSCALKTLSSFLSFLLLPLPNNMPRTDVILESLGERGEEADPDPPPLWTPESLCCWTTADSLCGTVAQVVVTILSRSLRCVLTKMRPSPTYVNNMWSALDASSLRLLPISRRTSSQRESRNTSSLLLDTSTLRCWNPSISTMNFNAGPSVMVFTKEVKTDTNLTACTVFGV